MKFYLTCCFALLLSIAAKAQKQQDYVITLKGDTVKCKISTPFIGASRYTLPNEKESRDFDTDTIKEYYITRKDRRERAVYIDGSKRPSFVTVVENGKISLYQVVRSNYSYNGAGTSTTEWYIGKDSNNVSSLKTSGLFMFGKSKQDRKDEFAEMLKDKPAVYDRYAAEKKFSFDAIRNLVHLYNTGSEIPKPPVVNNDGYN